MRIRPLVLGAMLIGSAAELLAQQTPVTSGRVAGIAPAPAQAPANSGSSFNAPLTFLFGNTPVTVFRDGRIYADFGQGWEEVVRGCTQSLSYGIPGISAPPLIQPVVFQPTVIQPTVQPTSVPWPTPPPASVSLPANYAQAQAQNGLPVEYTPRPGRQACFAVGPSGQVFIGRP
jgi:hypothetical protein